jgi:hypothetical protein
LSRGVRVTLTDPNQQQSLRLDFAITHQVKVNGLSLFAL